MSLLDECVETLETVDIMLSGEVRMSVSNPTENSNYEFKMKGDLLKKVRAIFLSWRGIKWLHVKGHNDELTEN